MDTLRSVLAELLRLYDWRREVGAVITKEQALRYGREKKAAWEAARRVLVLSENIATEATSVKAGLPAPAGIRAHDAASTTSPTDKSQQARQFWEEQARRFDDFYPLIAQLLRDRGTSAWLAAECDRLTADLKTLQSATTALMDESGKFFDWGNAASVALKNLLDAYERRIRSLCEGQEQLDRKPWECAEFIEARRILDAKPNWVIDASHPYVLVPPCDSK